jgi:hypothetical protein
MLKWTHYPLEQQFDNRHQGCGILTEVFASRLLLLCYHSSDGESGRGPAPRLRRIYAVVSMG